MSKNSKGLSRTTGKKNVQVKYNANISTDKYLPPKPASSPIRPSKPSKG